MKVNNLSKIRDIIQKKNPLVHAITNPISITQCANAILAVGAQPIMAEHPREVAEITLSANAVLMNIGNITDARMESILISAETSHKNHIPFVIDAVGVACSDLRKKYALSLIEKSSPDIIKGNYSEITALHDPSFKSSGVDTAANLTVDETKQIAIRLSKKYKTVVLASGKTDIVADGEKTVLINNGVPELSRITGTGCMLGALCATYLSTAHPRDAAVCACGVLGICGELSSTDKGNGSFLLNLIDNLSTLTAADFEKHLRMEVENIETH